MEFKDYYKILGLKPDAEFKEIKAAYRKLARKFHPDVSQEKDSEDRFKEVAEAYKVLKDSNSRAEYDELRQYGGSKEGFQPPPGWQGSGNAHSADGDFSEFFNSIFGGGFGNDGFDRGNSSRAGAGENFGFKAQDAEIEMPILLEETLSEESKMVEYIIPVVEQGQRRNVKKSLKVKIPAGVTEGQRVRLKGQGALGQNGEQNGDLYLHIRLIPHPLFDVEGHNLILTVPLTPWEAALGAKITVPTLSGKINLNIAANSQTGQKLRVKGKGLKTVSGYGDMFAVLKVMMPSANDQDGSNKEVINCWQELSKAIPFDPRAEWGQ